MPTKNIVKHSKFLSLLLRHQPETIGLSLDAGGWASVEELLAKLQVHGRTLSPIELDIIVRTNDKQRFSFNEDKTRIRANQGHSLKQVELGLAAIEPPPILYHGTASRFMQAISQQGLTRQSRQHVHLSADKDTAYKVGARHGLPVILQINAARMQQDGFVFYCSANGVWLTAQVPTRYFMPQAET